jgi:hypothetical protein
LPAACRRGMMMRWAGRPWSRFEVPSASAAPTLYEDWQARRGRLAVVVERLGPHAAIELRVLDYLLRQYRDSPDAAQPARFPIRTRLVVNERAVVVHNHLAQGQFDQVSSAQQAHDRVASIVQRMVSQSLADSSAGEPPWLEPSCPSASERERDGIRAQLASGEAKLRYYSILALSRVGNLDDIGLLSDLLALDEQDDEHPREREALAYAMQRIAGLTTAGFYETPRTLAGYDWCDTPLGQSWTCLKCGSKVPNTFEICPTCGAWPGGERPKQE